jgi:hypothetical protein
MEKAIRFGVGSESAGLKASSWRIWSNGGGDCSVYLACRELGRAIHTSFHESGRWHTGFVYERFPELFAAGHQPDTRFAGQWDRPHEFSPGWTMAALIYTSLRAMREKITAKPKGMFWVPPPANDQHCEIAILLGSDATDRIAWPGHPTINTTLVGRFEIGNGNQAVVVYRYVPEQQVKLPTEVKPRYFKDATETALVNGPVNAVMWGPGPYGATVFVDEAVDLTTR